MAKNPQGMQSPAEHNLPFDDLEIKTEDGIVVRGWRILQENSRNSPTIVFFHENAGSNIFPESQSIIFAPIKIFTC
jgi:hypothetical protein